ncbi:uncharacterized protein LOC141679980 [Apium graveolens]|uniref:uncharacterized protein LOC141679980 n=1 Tax=Apium graveolens TaxID=4045 RepID=UPI003D79596C
MAETHQDNKRKAVVLRKQQSIKKYRQQSRDDGRKEVQVIETLSYPNATKQGSEEQKSNQVTEGIELGLGIDQTNPTVQATSPEITEERNNKEMIAQAQIYMKKNTEARIQKMVSDTDQSKIEAAVETETILITTNNQAEYEALIAGLKLARTLRIQNLKIYSDSQIVVKQTNGECIAKDSVLAKYQALVQSYLTSIPKIQVIQISREENSEADALSKLVQNSSDLDCSVYFEELQKPSTESEEVMEIENSLNWMTPFINYLEKGKLPEDKGKAQRLKAKASKFFMEEGILYRRTFSSPTLKCIGPREAQYCLMEVHEGICGDHMSAKALALKIIRQGARGDLKYLLVSIDYMTKWVKAKAIRTINQQDCIKFMDNILMRFGIPRILVSDNGPQFVGSEFESYLQERGIRHKKSSIAYPQGNGQVEAVAKMEKYKQKTREHFSKKSWVKNFQIGDLVLRDTEASDPTNTGKLMPKWEGPYKVKEVLRPGTYKLMNMDESEVPNTWHRLRLRKFYQ